jgi:hypothetical protein
MSPPLAHAAPRSGVAFPWSTFFSCADAITVRPHPAAQHVLPPIEGGVRYGAKPSPTRSPDPAQIDKPPAWWRSNLRKKAAALADKLRSDTDLARAARERRRSPRSKMPSGAQKAKRKRDDR